MMELREGTYSSDDYQRIMKELQHVITSDNGLGFSELVIVAPKTIPKTTSGKISRSRVKKEYLGGTLSVVFRQRYDGDEDTITQTFEIENQSPATADSTQTVSNQGDETTNHSDPNEILLPSQLDHQNTVSAILIE